MTYMNIFRTLILLCKEADVMIGITHFLILIFLVNIGLCVYYAIQFGKLNKRVFNIVKDQSRKRLWNNSSFTVKDK